MYLIKNTLLCSTVKIVTKRVCFVIFIAYFYDSVNCTFWMESFEKRSVLINIREKQASQQKHEENIGIKWQ